MPELPEVETIVRGLRKYCLNKRIKEINVFYPKIIKGNIQLLKNDAFDKIERHGKYIKLTTQKGQRLVVHLRMTGQLFIADANYQPDKHVHIILKLFDGQKIIYRDIRKFGTWTFLPVNKDFQDFINVGKDALSLKTSELAELIKRKRKVKLKAFLLDQTNLAGIGNIYADEICFALGVDPEIEVGKISSAKLLKVIQNILKLSIKYQGTSVSDYVTSRGAKGSFQHILNVYKQKKCRKCGYNIVRKKVAGRSTHICPKCQKKRSGR